MSDKHTFKRKTYHIHRNIMLLEEEIRLFIPQGGLVR